jgi:hypothetical protein
LRLVLALSALLIATALAPLLGGASSPATPTPAFANYPATDGLGTSGGEPTVGIDPRTGDALVQATSQTLRVRFDDATSPAGATWSDVTDPLAPATNLDPDLFTDAATGRTWAGGLLGECSAMGYTDDGGATWTHMVNPCAPPGTDHETVASGPWSGGQPLGATYPRAVYYCVHEAEEMCATSWDGGLTFHPAVPIAVIATPYGAGCGGYTGKMRVASDGAAYITSRDCIDITNADGQGVIVSTDNGLTWTGHLLPGSPGQISPAFEPSVGTTPSGWVYAAWTDVDNHVYASLSKDHGATWSPASDLALPAGLISTTFSAVTAGDDERAAVAFLGTTDAGNAFDPSFPGTWDLYVAYTYDAGAHWQTVKATSDPVQRGWVCTGGATSSSCTTGEGRNLLDFITAMTDAKGRVVVAYADGCVAGCAVSGAAADSTSALVTLARQTCGPSLFAAQGEVEGSGACPTGAPPAPTPPWVQTKRYTSPVADADFGGPAFAVPPGSTSVHLAAVDDVDPHVGGEWCIDSCSGTIGFFCDGIDVALPAGASTVIVSPNTLGVIGPFECGLGAQPGGVATTGTVTATFT